jgi:exodeoxyribonuclease VII small subunit
MAKSSQPKRPNPEKMSFEEATEELEAIIERIEAGEIGLEESLAERRRGDALIRRCRAVLDQAEQELEQISSDEIAHDADDPAEESG